MNRGEARLQRDGLAISGSGFGKLPLVLQHIAQIVMGFGEIGLEKQRATEIRHRLFQFFLLPKHASQIIVRLGVIRIQGKGVAITIRSLVQPAQFAKRVPKIDMRPRIIRLEGDGLAVAGDGFVALSQVHEGQAQIEVIGGNAGIQPDRPAR